MKPEAFNPVVGYLPEGATTDGVDSCDRTICLICRTVLIHSSAGWVHESRRSMWDRHHREDVGGETFYVRPMPLNEPE